MTRRIRVSRCWTAFIRDDGGSVTIFAVIAFAMLLVMIGLVVDVGRIMNIHSEAQAYADRAALAAAAELDGRPCAIGRAIDAATGEDNDSDSSCFNSEEEIPDGRRMSLSGDHRPLRIANMRFYSSPTSTNPVRSWFGGSVPGPNPDNDRRARYVTVQTTQERERFLFFPIMVGAISQVTVAPRATAGFERSVCNAIPLMMCNPDERSSGGGPFTSDDENHTPSLHYNIPYYDWRSENNWEFSLLQLPVSGHDALRAFLENDNPNTMCFRDQVDRVRVERDFSRGERNAILEAFHSREGERLSVAVVNCRQHRVLLNTSQPVPVEAWASVRVRGVDYEDHRYDWSDDPHEHYELELRIEGVVSRNPSQGTVREYPVLAR